MSGQKNIKAVEDAAASPSVSDEDTPITADAPAAEAAPARNEAADAPSDDRNAVDENSWLDLEDTQIAPLPLKEPRFAWVVPFLAITAIFSWTILYAWAMRAELAQAANLPPRAWIGWIIDWSVPCLLIGVVWLLAMRNSRVEANRFAIAAGMLSHESAELETRLSTVNRELSLAREFLSSQSRDLDALGRMASERLSEHAGELKRLISDNSAQVVAIGSVSEAALANMNKLRDDLPVIANSARDVSNQIGSAGRTAQEQLSELEGGFKRLEQSGETSETQIKAFFGQIDETLSSFEDNLRRIENTMSTRFDTLKSQTESYRGEVVDAENQVIADLNERMALLQSETRAVSTKLRESEKEAMEQISLSKEHWKMEITAMLGSLTQLDRDRHAATQRQLKALYEEAKRVDERFKQHDARFIEEVSRRQDEFETREAQATEVLAQRFAALDEMLEQRREAQAAETDKLVQQASSLGEQIEALSALIANVTQETETSRERIGEGVSLIAAQFEGEREAIEEAKGQLNELTEAGIRLLEIIQSGARHSREDLPAAIQTAIAELGTVEARAEEVSALMLSTNARSGELGEYLAKTNSQIAEADASLGALQSRLNEQSDEAMAKLNGLRSGLAKLTEASVSYAGDTQETLRSAIAQLDDAARNALVTLENGAAAKVSELAGKLSSEAVSSLERSLQSETAETIGKLEQSAAHASGVGREVTMQLRDQLVKVNELTANLEQRIARAHEKAREEVDNDFARRMALITDSLNSASIDISASLSSEVADTAWDAYLKGDRGIFTRRAVRLVDAAQAREIAELYQSDETFKTNVSRYIHDFESMLRAMLSTRDGNALSVTVLGSDMGKLYVALAQAIERFRK